METIREYFLQEQEQMIGLNISAHFQVTQLPILFLIFFINFWVFQIANEGFRKKSESNVLAFTIKLDNAAVFAREKFQKTTTLS